MADTITFESAERIEISLAEAEKFITELKASIDSDDVQSPNDFTNVTAPQIDAIARDHGLEITTDLADFFWGSDGESMILGDEIFFKYLGNVTESQNIIIDAERVKQGLEKYFAKKAPK